MAGPGGTLNPRGPCSRPAALQGLVSAPAPLLTPRGGWWGRGAPAPDTLQGAGPMGTEGEATAWGTLPAVSGPRHEMDVTDAETRKREKRPRSPSCDTAVFAWVRAHRVPSWTLQGFLQSQNGHPCARGPPLPRLCQEPAPPASQSPRRGRQGGRSLLPVPAARPLGWGLTRAPRDPQEEGGCRPHVPGWKVTAPSWPAANCGHVPGQAPGSPVRETCGQEGALGPSGRSSPGAGVRQPRGRGAAAVAFLSGPRPVWASGSLFPQ